MTAVTLKIIFFSRPEVVRKSYAGFCMWRYGPPALATVSFLLPETKHVSPLSVLTLANYEIFGLKF